MALVDAILANLVRIGGSTVHLAVGAPPVFRRYGQLLRIAAEPLTSAHTRFLLDELLSDEERDAFLLLRELDFDHAVDGLGRFRVNAYLDRRGVDLCFRAIPETLPNFHDLGLPEILKTVVRERQGLVLVTGPAGSGKSTTLAALVDHLNASLVLQVITVEDPVEYLHPVKRGAVSQRQVGRHTRSFASAVRSALREDPDLIVISELRDLETIALALTAAETGHLVLASMNTSSSRKTLDRLIDSFPPAQQNQVRSTLGESLRAVFSQRLLPRRDRKGMVLAHELLLGSPQLAGLIREGKTFQIPSLLQTGRAQGLRALDDSLLELLTAGVVRPVDALPHASASALFARWRDEVAEAFPVD